MPSPCLFRARHHSFPPIRSTRQATLATLLYKDKRKRAIFAETGSNDTLIFLKSKAERHKPLLKNGERLQPRGTETFAGTGKRHAHPPETDWAYRQNGYAMPFAALALTISLLSHYA